jgi:uncharacterized protein YndB with AHSA1/START domain
MSDRTTTRTAPTRTVLIERVLDAPPDLVWRAWTDPDQLARWWGPKGVAIQTCRIDLRVGGKYLFCECMPEPADGREIWSTGVYQEIVTNRRLVCTFSFADEQGNVVPGSHYGLGPEFPPSMLITVTFEAAGGHTRMVLKHEGFPAGEDADTTEAGWNESFDKLAETLRGAAGERRVGKMSITLPSDREIRMTRWFDAPRELVFEVHTSCEHMNRWWGPRKYMNVVCEIDFRTGGAWRIVQRGPDGDEHGFRGEYREIVRPERITWTFEYEGAPGHISIETLELTEKDGGTILSATVRYDSFEDREAVLGSGMEGGAAETYDRLEEYLRARRG